MIPEGSGTGHHPFRGLQSWDNERVRIFRRRPATVRPLPRHWLQAEDGTFFRNYPLVRSEREAVLAWPDGTPGKYAIFQALAGEGHSLLTGGVLRKASLGPGDVAAAPALFRDAYPRNPGLWVLDDAAPSQDSGSDQDVNTRTFG
jgi:hypothetical protein